MSKQFIKDLTDKENIKSIFLVGDKQVLKDKKGKNYLNMNLSDKSGALNARMWDKVDLVAHQFDAGDFIEVKGHVQLYQNKKQIVVHDIKKITPDLVDIEDFVAVSEHPPEEVLNNILQIIDTVESENIKNILLSTLNDEKWKENIIKTPAAKTIHHAYVGGLLDHIYSICKIMVFMADHYIFLNKDLLIFGAIYHDIGKVRELSLEQGIQYTTEGRLVGHMGIALEMIDEKFKELNIDDQELKSVLKHIVLSHHGRLEYGSPKRPKFLEALVVSMIDELDSRINSVETLMSMELENNQDWTGYQQQYDRYFYLDILRKKK
ncbi:MAG: HD domain-containing protein [Bdellovibrionaceae bacterium]|nr:HD domain-containing protein [Pseudobdellovibrionaceae bacterium]